MGLYVEVATFDTPQLAAGWFIRSDYGCKGLSTLGACRRPQAATLVPRRGGGRSAFPRRGKVSWRTHRMARRKKDVSDLPYTASPLSCVAFFVKEQARSNQQAAERGTLLAVISNLE